MPATCQAQECADGSYTGVRRGSVFTGGLGGDGSKVVRRGGSKSRAIALDDLFSHQIW